LLWTTFTPEQIDIDVTHPQGVAYLDAILQRLHEANVHAVRLDAAGYARKEPGTSCFMIPETYDFINEFTAKARGLSMEVLVEVHSYYAEQVEIARHVDWVYDFALPPLVLHALFAADAQPLVEWLRIRPTNAITVLDTHDGIGVIDVGAAGPDRPGLLSPDQINQLVETMHVRSNGESRLATGDAANNLDLYQVNCTYFDALGRRENEYLLARALQFFVPGIPQVYYVGLFGGTNDMALLETSHVGRDINRHHFSEDEVLVALKQPMVEQLLALIALRNTHPAFQGSFSLDSASPSDLVLTWRHGTASAELVADLAARSARLTFLEADEAPVVITL